MPSTANYENLLAITSLQPSYIDPVTAVSGIPLHPDYVAERGTMSSSTISSFSKLRRMLQEAKYIRSLCKDQNGEWLDTGNAIQKISDHISYYCHGNLDNANYMAQILQQTSTSDTAPLRDILFWYWQVLWSLACRSFTFKVQSGQGKAQQFVLFVYFTPCCFAVETFLLFLHRMLLAISSQRTCLKHRSTATFTSLVMLPGAKLTSCE